MLLDSESAWLLLCLQHPWCTSSQADECLRSLLVHQCTEPLLRAAVMAILDSQVSSMLCPKLLLKGPVWKVRQDVLTVPERSPGQRSNSKFEPKAAQSTAWSGSFSLPAQKLFVKAPFKSRVELLQPVPLLLEPSIVCQYRLGAKQSLLWSERSNFYQSALARQLKSLTGLWLAFLDWLPCISQQELGSEQLTLAPRWVQIECQSFLASRETRSQLV